MIAGWQALPVRTRLLATAGAALTLVGAFLVSSAIAERDDARLLTRRGVPATATRVRVHVDDQNRGPQFDGVEVTFPTHDGRTVTTMLRGVVGHSADHPVGWREADDWPGYEQPLHVRYDPLDPSFAMAEADVRFEQDYPFVVGVLLLLALAVALLLPAAFGLRRGAEAARQDRVPSLPNSVP